MADAGITDKPLVILWVENGADHMGWACQSFKAQDIQTCFHKASGLQEARALLKKFRPDLIIADGLLPDGKGIDLIDPEGAQDTRFPVIIMSDHADEGLAVEVIKAGAMDFILKSEGSLSKLPHIAERALREWHLLLEQRLSRDSLRQSEERYRFWVENTLDGIFMAEARSGKCIFLNQGICDLFGYSREEVLTLSIWDVLAAEEHEIVKNRLEKALSQQYRFPDRQLYTAVRKDGSRFQAEASVSLAAFQGKTVIQGILRDVTEQHNVQRQLRHAYKMEAVGTLAGGIAHEFNNMMQAVSGYTELLLLNPDLDESSRKKLEAIQASTRRASELTRQILIFGRKVESEFRPVLLNQEVAHAGKLLTKTLPKMINVHLKLDPDLKNVRGDPAYLVQIVVNLGINARDAMPDGGDLIIETKNVCLNEREIRKYPDLIPGEYVLLSISDTGHGMKKDVVDQIFDPFYTTKKSDKHRGLGLSLVYGIVKEHSGHITCESQPGRGTTFQVYLPVIKPIRETVPAEIPLPFRGQETILLVDDEKIIRDFSEYFLKDFGYTVITAPDGETALEILTQRQNAIDLIILDLVMPGMGGQKCLQEILTRDPLAKVIVVSGYSGLECDREALKKGARGFMGKPYEMNEMLKMIRKILDEG